MIVGLAALILLSTATLIQAAEVPHLISSTEAELGSNVTFQCPFMEKEDRFFNWYKQSLGEMVQPVSTGVYKDINLIQPFNSPRFRVHKVNDHFFLTISNVNKEDEAMYFCQSGAEFLQLFKTGFFLAVHDYNQQTSVHVRQTPETASVQLGYPVTLQCSLLSKSKGNRAQCPDDHSVYWFRAVSGGRHPSIIYTHWNRTDRDPGRRCVYHLSKTIQSSSDAGTYYCAVVTCGEILFGEGTKVETRRELDPTVLVLGALLGCCVTVIAVLVFYAYQRGACERCKGALSASHHRGHDESTVDRSNDSAGDADTVNYAAMNFSTRKSKREKKKRELPQECIYSAVQ